MAKVGQIVYVNEIRHDDGADIEVESPAIVLALADTQQGYGKDQNFATVKVFYADRPDVVLELNQGTEVGNWSETPFTEAVPTEPPPSEQ